jgi:hypothetical protein
MNCSVTAARMHAHSCAGCARAVQNTVLRRSAAACPTSAAACPTE